ncbi:anti-sigma factor family protein [Inmirania thermothiophila]|uniref:Anti-sigma factor RsiW n=1 Tax=Inmirania thermothiophila TaxID=1750597 RepID=A0A3N1YAJ4_9GAMM|nr:anti-sigma factor [Inmirania thermothiophila]ROR34652.1 anti-sigma factor RsiW [Inmirania thermothiophila]
MSGGRIAEADLHAYVDGLLPAERRAQVESWLAEHPEEAARLAAYARIGDAVRARFQEVVEEPVPARLLVWRRRRRPGPLLAVAAALALGIAVGWFARGLEPGGLGGSGAPAERALAVRAAVAHAVYAPEVRHPVEVSAGEEAHLAAWLGKRLGAPLRPPRLGEAGFTLVGGRLLPGEAGPAAQFMYEDRAGRRLTLYVAREARRGDTAFRYLREGGVSVFYWVDGPFGYALSGALERAELLAVARRVYAELAGDASDAASASGEARGALQAVPRQTQAASPRAR